MRIPVVGQTYESRSVAVDAQRTINFYVERVESGTGKVKAVLYPTPGLQAFGVLGTDPVRALYTELGRVFAIAGTQLHEVYRDGTSVVLGTVANDGKRATLRCNGLQGHQLFVVSGGYGYNGGGGPFFGGFGGGGSSSGGGGGGGVALAGAHRDPVHGAPGCF
jgi:uncharacterized membrane protein YgcG